MLETLQEIDNQLLLWFNGLHHDSLDNFMYAFSGKWVWGFMYAAILYALIRTLGWRRGLVCALGAILVVALADQTCATFIRPVVERLRPTHLDNPLSDHVHIVAGYRGGAYGFPSCHAANSIGVAVFLSLVFARRRVWLFLMLWAITNCYTRMYLGVHYPGDLVVGAIVGACWALVIYTVYRYVARHISDNGLPTPILAIGGRDLFPCDIFIATGLATTIVLLVISLFA